MKKIVLIITGSVAAFKALELIRLLKLDGFDVIPVLSTGGEAFITPLSVSSLSGNEVLTKDTHKMEHISLSRNADLILICPASASFIGKIAGGIGGELALDIILAKRPETPIIIAPAMNVEMWNSRFLQDNLKNLEEKDFIIIPPISGKLLCEEEGSGKLPNVNDIKTEICQFLKLKESLKGLKFLITNGATIERIDSARFISNFSSGLQGALIAKEILKRGGEVFLIEGSTSYNFKISGSKLQSIKVESATDMLEATLSIVQKNIIEGFFSVAAVADFTIRNRVEGKIKKDKFPALEFTENVDILETIGKLKKNRPKIVIGFAAEEEKNLVTNGAKKLQKKNCDFLFSNSMCFVAKNTSGVLLSRYGSKVKFSGLKSDLANLLLENLHIQEVL